MMSWPNGKKVPIGREGKTEGYNEQNVYAGKESRAGGTGVQAYPLTSYPLQIMVTCIYTATLGTKGITKMPETCPISELTYFILQLQHVTLF